MGGNQQTCERQTKKRKKEIDIHVYDIDRKYAHIKRGNIISISTQLLLHIHTLHNSCIDFFSLIIIWLFDIAIQDENHA